MEVKKESDKRNPEVIEQIIFRLKLKPILEEFDVAPPVIVGFSLTLEEEKSDG